MIGQDRAEKLALTAKLGLQTLAKCEQSAELATLSPLSRGQLGFLDVLDVLQARGTSAFVTYCEASSR